MPRVLLVQPSLQPPGGGNGVAAWMLQALVAEHHVTVLSWRPVEVEPINRFFGTSLRASDFDSIVVPRHWSYVPDHLPVPAALIRSALLMRYTRRLIDRFDVLVGVHNETDYGRRGIQYVHYPSYLRPRPAVDLRWYHRPKSLLSAYYSLADRLADFSVERMKSNVTLANSNWTAGLLRRSLGVNARTVYPPVVGLDRQTGWQERRPGFLAIGRISPEKEYERLIRILSEVRDSIPEVTLTIVGTWDRHVRRYYDELRRLAEVAGPWVEFRHDLSRNEVNALMVSSRFGIHGMREEHFGMAPAEMVRAGMIVWLPNGGGQVEIVEGNPQLVFDSDQQAVDQIVGVLSDPHQQRHLQEALQARSERFSTARFVKEVREVVATFRE
jgi:glycosyltransferase involved in cell wall biosynthesis